VSRFDCCLAIFAHAYSSIQIVAWIAGVLLVVICFLSLAGLLRLHDQKWTFLIPGSLSLIGAIIGICIIVASTQGAGGQTDSGAMNFGVALGRVDEFDQAKSGGEADE
jgi:hypothetical protein